MLSDTLLAYYASLSYGGHYIRSVMYNQLQIGRTTLGMLHHGLRRAEVTSLRTSSIGSERGYMTLTIHGKGGKVRVHPMQQKVIDALVAYLAADRRSLKIDAALFCSTRSGSQLSTQTVSQIVVGRCKAAGINKHITPHSLRHTAITCALDANASIRRVAQFAGHSDPKTTSTYDLDRSNLDDNASHKILYR